MTRFYTAEQCKNKADQHWEMAGLARQDNDPKDAERHTEEARKWDQRARSGGYQKGEER
ncbi:hypothetical protein CPT_Summit_119 [Stenotrophomonas phage Summit]|nr:hypothetical protein CPT_Summit_119 [Stenotrophomonas phage Summit]